MKLPCAHILASKRNGALYVDVTSDVVQRVGQHRTDALEGFSKRYGVHRLVYAEFHDTMEGAIRREKQIKHWRRAWKLELIERENPEWEGLYPAFVPGLDPRFRGGDK